MRRLRRYSSRLEADRAAAFLRRNGVPATVVGDHVHSIFGIRDLRMLQMDLMLLHEAQRDRAEQLLEEFESEPIQLEPDWEEQARPDLSELDLSGYRLNCAQCGHDLTGQRRQRGECPECGAGYDLVELLVARYGPEALAECYDPGPSEEDEARRPPPTPYRDCGYDLAPMPVRGRCPACGRLFDKSESR